MKLLSYTIVDFHLFIVVAVDLQIWATNKKSVYSQWYPGDR